MLKPRFGRVVLCLAIIFASACGGSSYDGAPTSPSPTPSPAPSPAPAPTPTPSPNPSPPPSAGPFVATFVFDDGISSTDRRLVESNTAASQDYFTARFGHGMRGSVTVNVRAADCPTQALRGARVDLCNNWLRGGSLIRRTRTVVHEFFHIVQQQNGLSGGRPCAGCPDSISPWWHLEGSAEYVAWAFVADKGMASYQQVRDCQIANYFGGGGPNAPPLSQMNTGDSDPGAYYVTAWLGWNQLLSGLSGASKITAWVGGSGFDSAFGISSDRFSTEFESYRRTLVRPNTGCPF